MTKSRGIYVWRKPDPTKSSTRICPRCGTSFVRRKTQPGNYCSGACWNATRAETRTEKTCPECGAVFGYLKSWPRIYCSHRCRSTAVARAGTGLIRPSRYTATCESCGRSFETTPGITRGRFCSRPCWGAWLSASGVNNGDASPNWRGGHEPYYGPSWPQARRAVRSRDKVCVDCGKTPEQNGRGLDVHHIVRFASFGLPRHKEANALSNLVALCVACHTTREWRSGRRLG